MEVPNSGCKPERDINCKPVPQIWLLGILIHSQLVMCSLGGRMTHFVECGSALVWVWSGELWLTSHIQTNPSMNESYRPCLLYKTLTHSWTPLHTQAVCRCGSVKIFLLRSNGDTQRWPVTLSFWTFSFPSGSNTFRLKKNNFNGLNVACLFEDAGKPNDLTQFSCGAGSLQTSSRGLIHDTCEFAGLSVQQLFIMTQETQ